MCQIAADEYHPHKQRRKASNENQRRRISSKKSLKFREKIQERNLCNNNDDELKAESVF